MTNLLQDIFTDPKPIHRNTLENLGPLSKMAGVWTGNSGQDISPEADGPKKQSYIERMELHPIDPQTNGPQLLYGLRYHVHITKPGQVKTYHDQVGYWLWEPSTKSVIHTLTIPRGLTAMAHGKADSNSEEFELIATQGSETYGICSASFLDQAFKTIEFRIKIKFNSNDTWSYEQDTVIKIAGQKELFHHTDKNTLHRVANPIQNPMALGHSNS